MILKPADVTAQSRRSLVKHLQSRGPGEPLSDALRLIDDALAQGCSIKIEVLARRLAEEEYEQPDHWDYQ